MHAFCRLLILTYLISCSSFPESGDNCADRGEDLYFPSQSMGELFADVQLSGYYSDSKTFVDCCPLLPPDSLIRIYARQVQSGRFSPGIFAAKYFSSPYPPVPDLTWRQGATLEETLMNKWDFLTRIPGPDTVISSLLELPEPYVVPGGRFREIYYWDSYFTMEGLAASDRMDLVRHMLNNFSCLIYQYGHIPNGNRSYYLSRSQPPFFAEMVNLLMREEGDSAGIPYLLPLRAEYNFWMKGAPDSLRVVQVDNILVNRFWDNRPEPRPESYREDVHLAQSVDVEKRDELYRNIRSACESGWDFSSRWMEDSQDLATLQTTSIVPVDLNCLLLNLEQVLSGLYALSGMQDSAQIFAELANQRAGAIRDLFWRDKHNYFFDYDLDSHSVNPVYTLAGAIPLYFGVANDIQAEQVVEIIRKNFLKDGGVVTTLSNTGQQWDAPNGWAPLQWMTVRGLEDYGYSGLADTIATRWLTLNQRVFRRTGKIMEKYNVMDTTLAAGGGEYPLQDGFGWTNGIYLAFLRRGYAPAD